TPPHFWALALRFSGQYAKAGVPMLPVVAGVRRTTRQIVGYSVLVVATSLALVPAAGMGPVYWISALVLGAWFVAGAVRLQRRDGRAPMRLFRDSITYLALLFAAVAVDTLIRFGP
ncbi:MAG TPA: UbiA family prenyltransferase, partial [Actinomycetota bacterium]|nr:UbiA family prenyltransferase [Actinomycetota bacterium]